ncbi:MAG: acyl-CoA thioesterase, partial [Planctomycetota bacterium]
MGETNGSEPQRFCMRWVADPRDVDDLGHISNITYVRWLQEVAKRHSEAVGWDLARYRREGGVFVVRRHEITYVQPAFAGDEIEGCTWVECWHGASCVRHTEIRRNGERRPLARARTDWVLVDPETG